ncbi:TIGR03087 family PEP-CTERM/XrtA system glycosyltransferase [Parasphingorhabdus sp. JC815]|uniref:TIGR03087 family PEP-CTERM/XrtA system glycosyltransferase n=1 Tax=Parasphingorhabdus sp. JC815 TaxID=3232140 RepID=UPI00345AD47C
MAHRVPWPPNRGDKIRSHHILRKMVKHASVHLACFADDEAEALTDSDIKSSLASVQIVRRNKANWRAGIEALATGKPVSLTSFDSAKIRNYVRDTLNIGTIDCIFVFSGQMAQFVPAEYSGRLVMDFADVDSAKFESYAEAGSGPMGWINQREGRLLRAFEQKIAIAADYSLFVSEAEAQLFRSRSGLDDKVKAIGNGIDLDFYDPDIVPDASNEVEAIMRKKAHVQNGPLILFTGQMDYRPNVEAVTSFSAKVMPKILNHYPDAHFIIAGRAPSADVLRFDGVNGTIVTGGVDDIRCWLKAADIVVAPLRIARGIQNKVLEAMALGKPVVASVAAAQGIEAVDGKDFCIAQNPDHEAKLVCELLANHKKAASLGRNAFALMRAKYCWESRLADINSLCGIDARDMSETAK